MVNENPEEATPNEEPVAGEPGSEDENPAGGAEDGNETPDDGTSLNPKAFKGLQRRLSAKDREIQNLSQRVEELQSQSQTGDLSIDEVVQLVRPVIQRIAQDDPDYARQVASGIAAHIDQRRNQTAQQELNQYKERERKQAEEQDVLNDLRETAADLGADPDDDGIDYGDASMSLRERLALVRQSAKELARPAEPTPPKPKPNTSEVVSSNAGRPPNPRGNKVEYTRADYDKELAAFTDTRKREHLVKAQEIKAYLVAEAEKNLRRPD